MLQLDTTTPSFNVIQRRGPASGEYILDFNVFSVEKEFLNHAHCPVFRVHLKLYLWLSCEFRSLNSAVNLGANKA